MSESDSLVRSARATVRAKPAEHRTEPLRSGVLDGLAQAYKTPLTAILVASSGLSEMGGLSPTQADLLAVIDEKARLLSELTTRLLTNARLDAMETEIHGKPVGVEPIIDEVVAGFRSRLAGKKFAIDLNEDSLVLCCDRQLILMLLTQYIENAFKHSTIGTAITICAVHANSEVIFSVHNFGSIIPVADRECIFDHYPLQSSFANRTGNTGFGLAVAKRIASVHRGRVWVTSGEAEGTTFFAAIPAPLQERCS